MPTLPLHFPLAMISACVAVCTALANDPGGGAPGVGANVTLTTTATAATLDNGVIQAVIDKATGKVTSYKLNGFQMVDPANPIYYSMDGGATFDVPSGCVYSLVASSPDHVEISCKRTWNASAGYRHNFDIDLHYVLRRGDTGLYAFAYLDHPASYPAATVGEWRIVWKLPRSSTTFTFERAYVDAARHWEMPSYYDYQNASPTAIGEIVKLNTGVMAGEYDGKYTYSARYSEIGTWGHASDIAKKGVWFVLGGHDYFNDGPTHRDLTSSESYILMHFGRNHYGGSGISVAEGESWRKIFGPFLLYCNATSSAANAGDALWADAQAQVAAEESAWPYSWLANADHPAPAARGSVAGRLLVNDPLKPAITGAYANIGLAAPEDTNGNWQFQSKAYQYWTRADASGNFTIPAVRPGTYTLYAFADGVTGEFSKTGITITAGGTNAQGDITWNVTHPGNSIAWEIGTPNRSASEFRHGDDYFTPFLWEVYPQEFANPLVFNVGTSDPAKDWNYVHSNYPGTAPGTTTAWDWNVNFNLPAVPESGNATLTIAVASAHYARLFLYLNGETASFARVSPPVGGGNVLLRQGIHAKYSVVEIPIPVSRLRTGSNTFTFRFTGDPGFSPHVMYDYLRLELPPFPPPPPDSGRAIVWAGGTSASANTWDVGVTPSFKHGGSATAFGTGDEVIFDDTGSNATSITLAESIEANQVTFSTAKNHTLGGGGSLEGTMKLEKSGGGTLTLPGANGFSGGATIHAGTLAISHAVALGSGTVTLSGGTLATGAVAPANPIVVTAASTISGGSGGGLQGIKTVSGSAPLTLNATSVFDLEGTLSSFSGEVFLTGSGSFRFNGSDGSSAASFDLGSRKLEARNGGSYRLGSLTGGPAAVLGVTGTTSGVTFTVGGNHESTDFPGTISNGSGTTHLIKTGTGTLMLSGTSTHTGATTVSQGTLKVTGKLGVTAVTVNADATLHAAGTLEVASLTLLPSATTVIDAGPAALPIQVAGELKLDGELRINPASVLAFGRFPLIIHGGIRTGNFELTAMEGGIPHHLAYAPNEVVLFIDDSDEDGLPDTWEQDHLDGLAENAAGDPDGDGTSNLAEQRLGLDPADGASAFRGAFEGRTLIWPSAPGIVFTVKRSLTLDPDGWQIVGTVTGGEEPTATFSDPDSFGSAFYRIEFAP